MRGPMETVHLPLSCQESPDCGGTHLQEEPSGLLIDREMSMRGEVLHEEGHACCQTDRTQKGAGCPDGDECLLHGGTIPGRTVSVDMLRGVRHQDTVSQEIPLSCLMQDTGCISPAVSRGFTEIIQHGRLCCFACLDVPLCFDHRELLPFLGTPLGYNNILGGIVSSIPAAPFMSQGPALFCHPSDTFFHEFTEPFQVHNR